MSRFRDVQYCCPRCVPGATNAECDEAKKNRVGTLGMLQKMRCAQTSRRCTQIEHGPLATDDDIK